MTTAPPRHRLWNPTQGISFSPGLLSATSLAQTPRALSEAPFTTSRERLVQNRTSSSGESSRKRGAVTQPFSTTVTSTTTAPIYPGADLRVAPGARGNNVVGMAPATAASEALLEAATKHPPVAALDFKIVDGLFYAAKNAPPGSPESFWSYTQYRRTAEDGTEHKVKVHYCRSKHTMEKVCRQYFMNEPILGFDLEWIAEASKHHGLRKNVSLIQLASPSRIALFHVALYADSDDMVGPSFRAIMEDAGITKVGVSIKGDATRLRNFLDIDSKGLLELSHLYRLVTFSSRGQYHMINRKLIPLATQVKEYLHLPLFKGLNVRSSDWTKPLTMDQVIYSASDAYAGVHLYATLEHHRKQLNPCPPTPHHAERNLPIRLAPGVELATSDELTEATEDAVAAGTSGTASEIYVTSVLESIKIEDNDNKSSTTVSAAATSTTTVTATTCAKPKKSPRASSPMPEKDSRVEAAEDRAVTFRASRPRTRASFVALRAYYLWHCYDLRPEEVGRLLRDPPLRTSTVANYVLAAIRAEHLLFDEDRLLAEIMPEFPTHIVRLRFGALMNYLRTGTWAETEPVVDGNQGMEDGEEIGKWEEVEVEGDDEVEAH
ncbi:hypothetical protein F4809DRAFT_645788 [Biscogniauxia mediterranea]|nr:hypothetical protein F4809DRAFT_645788 [Biscogniauxia mediterranea]